LADPLQRISIWWMLSVQGTSVGFSETMARLAWTFYWCLW
jgi:hypothetical protein